MALPRGQVKEHITNAVQVATDRVTERADEMFTSEIASAGNGTASPFHKLLLPEAKIYSSFERSFSASLGKAFDYIAAAIARETYGNGEHDFSLKGTVSTSTLAQIEAIVSKYKQRIGAQPDTLAELEILKTVVNSSKADLERTVKSDVFFVDHEGFKNYLEIKTAMPNYDQLASMKVRILTIHAMNLSAESRVRALAGFPHNPAGLAGTYSWPPMRYFLDPRHDWYARGEILMGPGLWNFIGNSADTYEQLLECFYEVSMERKADLRSLLKITGE